MARKTSDSIFSIQQMQEKYGSKGKKLNVASVSGRKHLT